MIRRISFVFAFAILCVGLMSGIASAADTVTVTKNVTVFGNAFDTGAIISYIIGTALPLVVAFVAKESWNPFLKQIVHLFLAAVTAVLAQVLQASQTNVPFAWQSVVLSAILTFAVGVLTYKSGLDAPALFLQRNAGLTDKVAQPVLNGGLKHDLGDGRVEQVVPNDGLTGGGDHR